MKISFYKGCYNRNVKIKSETVDVFLLGGWDADEKDWDNHLSLLKQILIRMSEQFYQNKPESLNLIYRYYVESQYKEINYNEPIEENLDEVLSRTVKFIEEYDLNKESYSRNEFICLIEEYLSALAADSEQDKSYSCEQCGDTNYSYDIEFNF